MATIAVLFAKHASKLERYYVSNLAPIWREMGHEVIFLFGTRRFVPADLLLLHVDLSVVPRDYLRFADRYPKSLNRHISDIRKSSFSTQIVRQDDSWTGPVIVKSDLNFKGGPENAFRRTWLERRFLLVRRARCVIESRLRRWRSSQPLESYKVYAGIGDVPKPWFFLKDRVVEKFLPEMENELFHLRTYAFLGDRYLSARLGATDPIVKFRNSISVVDVNPHPIVEEWRGRFGIDYGKFDYVIVDGEPILLDINKTMGSNPGPRSQGVVNSRHRHLAEGIEAFL